MDACTFNRDSPGFFLDPIWMLSRLPTILCSTSHYGIDESKSRRGTVDCRYREMLATAAATAAAAAILSLKSVPLEFPAKNHKLEPIEPMNLHHLIRN